MKNIYGKALLSAMSAAVMNVAAVDFSRMNSQEVLSYVESESESIADVELYEALKTSSLSSQELLYVYENTLDLIPEAQSRIILESYQASKGAQSSSSGISASTYIYGGLGVLGLGLVAGDGGGSGDSSTSLEESTSWQPVDDFAKDREYARMGGQDLVSVRAMHDRGYTGKSATVAIMDSGAYTRHNDLVGSFSGYLNAYTQSEDELDVQDIVGHGSHVAGIVGANQNDSGIVGYAPDASMLAVKIINDAGKFDTTDSQDAYAFGWARAHGADFINNSWGSSDTTASMDAFDFFQAMPSLLTEFRYSATQDVVYVWANGNDGTDQPSVYAALPGLYPELKDNWVAVASVDETGLIHWSSQACGRAAEWCISAPGTNIDSVSAYYQDGLTTMTGTSMAAPAVTGALAALKDRFPMLSNAEVVDRLFITANKGGIYSNEALYGQGLMDLDAASRPIGEVTIMSVDGSAGTPLEDTRIVSASAFGMNEALKGLQVMALDSKGAGFMYDLGDLVVSYDSGYDSEIARKNMETKSLGEARKIGSVSVKLNASQFYGGGANPANKNVVMSVDGLEGQEFMVAQVEKADMMMKDDFLSGNTQQDVSLMAPFWVESSFSEDERSLISGMAQKFDVTGGELNLLALSASDRRGVSAKYTTELSGTYKFSVDVGAIQGADGILGTKGVGALSLGDESVTKFLGVGGVGKLGQVNFYHNFYVGQASAKPKAGIISDMSDAVLTSWLAGAHIEEGSTRIGVLVAQPMRADKASAKIDYVSGFFGDSYVSSNKNVDLSPSGRQINTEIFYTFSGERDSIKASLMLIDEPGHNSRAKSDHAFMLSYTAEF